MICFLFRYVKCVKYCILLYNKGCVIVCFFSIFVSILFPLAYFIFIVIQAVILKFDTSILIPNSTTPLIYPYFFVNIETQGVLGVLKWVGILLVAFVAMGFGFYGLDRIRRKK